MKAILLTLAILFHFLSCAAQQYKTRVDRIDLNLDFENGRQENGVPVGWFDWGREYKLQIDTVTRHSGKSSVLIESFGERGPNSVGYIGQAIASNYEAKEIELRAFIKMNNVADGQVGLVLRLDGPDGMVALENLYSKNIQGTSDWEEYTVKFSLTEMVKTIYIGASLSGTGQLWIDDFQVLWDGKDINAAPFRRPQDYKAEADHEFDRGSGIGEITLNKTKIDHLDILGKVWGFLKYYHPAVARGNYNWDYELFRILPRILNATSAGERNGIIYDWIPPLATTEKQQIADTTHSEIKLTPDLSWINEARLGKELTSALQFVKGAQRSYQNYYGERVQTPAGWRFVREFPYYQEYPDAGYRLLCLYRYWNVINYFFPYRYLIDEDWNAVLEEFIPIFMNAKNETDHVLAALSIIARIHDTHANIWGMNNALNEYKGERYASLKVTFIDKKAVVTGYHNRVGGSQNGIRVGDVIESVDGKSIDEIVKNRLKLTPTSNYPTKLRNIARDLLRTNDTTLTIGYTSGSKRLNTALRTYPPEVHQNIRDTCFKMLESDIAYIFPGSIKNKYLPDIMREVKKSKGLIIDFRCYPSDPIMQTLTSYLSPDVSAFAKFTTHDIRTPGLFTMMNPINAGTKNKDYYKGKVVVIINEQTQSQAEFTTMALRTVPRVTVIGSTTAGADGDMCWVYLPGRIETSFSGLGVYYPDGRETQRIGIVSDIVVNPTIKGIMNGRDELLEKAIKIIK